MGESIDARCAVHSWSDRHGCRRIPTSSAAFGVIVDPVIAELHRRTPHGTRPDAKELTGLVYDALDRAGIEVTIKPPVPLNGRQKPPKAETTETVEPLTFQWL